jgi:hypothetical protein
MESVYNEIISDSDLCNETYSLDVLRKNINNLNKKVVLRTQKLTAQFCVKFILDTTIESGNQESGVYSKEHILRMQPHITNKEFDKCYLEYVIKGNSINTI